MVDKQKQKPGQDPGHETRNSHGSARPGTGNRLAGVPLQLWEALKERYEPKKKPLPVPEPKRIERSEMEKLLQNLRGPANISAMRHMDKEVALRTAAVFFRDHKKIHRSDICEIICAIFGSDVVDDLFGNSETPNTAHLHAFCIAEMHWSAFSDEEKIDIMKTALTCKDKDVRAAAEQHLERLDIECKAYVLLELMTSEKHEISAAALRAAGDMLAYIPKSQVPAFIRRMLGSKNQGIARKGLALLTKYDGEDKFDLLKAAVESRVEKIHADAMKLVASRMGEFDPAEKAQLLIAALKSGQVTATCEMPALMQSCFGLLGPKERMELLKEAVTCLADRIRKKAFELGCGLSAEERLELLEHVVRVDLHADITDALALAYGLPVKKRVEICCMLLGSRFDNAFGAVMQELSLLECAQEIGEGEITRALASVFSAKIDRARMRGVLALVDKRPPEACYEIIKAALDCSDAEVKERAFLMALRLPPELRDELIFTKNQEIINIVRPTVKT